MSRMRSQILYGASYVTLLWVSVTLNNWVSIIIWSLVCHSLMSLCYLEQLSINYYIYFFSRSYYFRAYDVFNLKLKEIDRGLIVRSIFFLCVLELSCEKISCPENIFWRADPGSLFYCYFLCLWETTQYSLV